MIQEKDFLYRVPVKNALVATPGQQVRNPEILVDLEGGEFMRGNMLDANSTNKLINQSVKDAVDNKLIESGHVTQDLLDAETSARTKGDEDLSAKIQAEQTRAEGKEKEISDKLAIVDGDSNTEGSFRKAIADVVAAAPEDLDTLKEIADKLAGNDDLHTALNQAITEKADTSALLNEVTRATGVENDLKTAISAKQDAGNYIPYDASDEDRYAIDKFLELRDENDGAMTISLGNINSSQNGGSNVYDISSTGLSGQYMASQYSLDSDNGIMLQNGDNTLRLDYDGLITTNGNKKIKVLPNLIEAVDSGILIHIDPSGIKLADRNLNSITLTVYGVTLSRGDNRHVLTSKGSTIDITEYALKTQLDTKQDKPDDGKEFLQGESDGGTIVVNNGLRFQDSIHDQVFSVIGSAGITVYNNADSESQVNIMSTGILADDKRKSDTKVWNTNGGITDLLPYATNEDVGKQFNEISIGMSNFANQIALKQNKITANTIDVTGIETADISKLRTIVSNLLDALTLSGLIKQNAGL